MLYSHIDHYPINNVYEFAKACEYGKIPKMESIMQGFFNNLMIEYMDHQTKVLEYEYAFWFGLERAAGTNQHEAIKYIFEHPNLKMFKDNIEVSMKQLNKNITNIITVDKADKINSDESTRVLQIAAENCNFESFELLKQLHSNQAINIAEIYMNFFRKLNPTIFEKLLTIPNFESMVNENTEKAIEYILNHQNIYSMRLLKEYFNINTNKLISLVKQHKNNTDKQDIKLFCDKVLLELELQGKSGKNKVKKI